MKILAAAALAIGFGVASAQAMPVSSLGDTVAPTAQTVGWRCGGPGWHMNPWGHCVPNRRFYGGPRFYGGWGHRGWHHGWHHGHWRRHW